MAKSRSFSIVTLAVVALASIGAGCKMHRRPGLLSQDPTPSMAGTWSGTMNYTFQGSAVVSTGTVMMSVLQDTLNIDGTYTAPAAQSLLFGAAGTVEGVTTGHSFLVTLKPTDATCSSNLQIGGTNDGEEIQFSVSGVDCSSASFTGQGYFEKQH